jgi:hypothetical protein
MLFLPEHMHFEQQTKQGKMSHKILSAGYFRTKKNLLVIRNSVSICNSRVFCKPTIGDNNGEQWQDNLFEAI